MGARDHKPCQGEGPRPQTDQGALLGKHHKLSQGPWTNELPSIWIIPAPPGPALIGFTLESSHRTHADVHDDFLFACVFAMPKLKFYDYPPALSFKFDCEPLALLES